MTTVPLSDQLLQQLLHWSGVSDHEEAIRLAVQAYIRTRKRQRIRELKGQLPLETDLITLRGGE